ncbi:MAG: uroporphyrinogen-III decarboxylase [Bacteroidetes bacterium]|nr:uroporphyrinogen-III decarboxylase [Bacteroidota bacterium]
MRSLSERILASPRRLAMPVLSFPGAMLAGTTVQKMVTDTGHQVAAQLALHKKFNTSFLMSAMDLSVEAEEFGSTIQMSDWEIPTVTGRLVTDDAAIRALRIPAVGSRRTRVYLGTIERLVSSAKDSMVLGGMIGPFSLAGRLFGVSEALAETAGEPEAMHALVEKATAFLTAYAQAYKKAGAHGVIIAEPTAGLISPASVREFSSPYVRSIIEAVEDGGFQIILHNCAARIGHLDAKREAGARIYHFGKPMDIGAALKRVPEDIVICGNLDPSEVFVGSSAEEVTSRTTALLDATGSHRNFVISSGCDIPAQSPMANLEAFFTSVG